jgi:hypothetical protein
MAVATLNNCTEDSPGHFVAEASTMGIPPGKCLTIIDTYLGNRLPFIHDTSERDADGDVVAWKYVQMHNTVTLTIFND